MHVWDLKGSGGGDRLGVNNNCQLNEAQAHSVLPQCLVASTCIAWRMHLTSWLGVAVNACFGIGRDAVEAIAWG